jgi:membrane protein DedA with SNARE-associated domain
MDSLAYLLTHYGYLAIFLLLTVGIFGIPLPDEFLVAFIGYLIFQREMHFWPAALAVISGGIMGISVNYVVGRTVGTRLCNGLGYFFPKKRQRLNYVTDWLGHSGGPVRFWAISCRGQDIGPPSGPGSSNCLRGFAPSLLIPPWSSGH